jgi:hypothetical protein
MASTKKVVTKGRRRVNQGQWVAMAKTRAITEIKNKIQYNPFELLFTSMIKILRKNRVQNQIISFKPQEGFTNLVKVYYFRHNVYFTHDR